MTLIAVAGAKGAFGVTTLSMALARTLSPSSEALLVEADPDGGVVAARLGLSQEPGLGTLAAAGRHGLSDQLVSDHTQAAPGARVIVAPSSPSQVRAALRSLSSRVEEALSLTENLTVVMDLGRLDAEAPTMPFARLANHVLFLTAPKLEGADALAVRLVELEDVRSRIGFITVGDGPYDGAELAHVLGVPLIGHLPQDPLGAEALWAGKPSKKRRPLLRAISEIVRGLSETKDEAPRLIAETSTNGLAPSAR